MHLELVGDPVDEIPARLAVRRRQRPNSRNRS
jgi:hypothetical protein